LTTAIYAAAAFFQPGSTAVPQAFCVFPRQSAYAEIWLNREIFAYHFFPLRFFDAGGVFRAGFPAAAHPVPEQVGRGLYRRLRFVLPHFIRAHGVRRLYFPGALPAARLDFLNPQNPVKMERNIL